MRRILFQVGKLQFQLTKQRAALRGLPELLVPQLLDRELEFLNQQRPGLGLSFRSQPRRSLLPPARMKAAAPAGTAPAASGTTGSHESRPREQRRKRPRPVLAPLQQSAPSQPASSAGRRCTDVMTSTGFVIGLVLVLALGLAAMTHSRKAAVTGRLLYL